MNLKVKRERQSPSLRRALNLINTIDQKMNDHFNFIHFSVFSFSEAQKKEGIVRLSTRESPCLGMKLKWIFLVYVFFLGSILIWFETETRDENDTKSIFPSSAFCLFPFSPFSSRPDYVIKKVISNKKEHCFLLTCFHRKRRRFELWTIWRKRESFLDFYKYPRKRTLFRNMETACWKRHSIWSKSCLYKSSFELDMVADENIRRLVVVDHTTLKTWNNESPTNTWRAGQKMFLHQNKFNVSSSIPSVLSCDSSMFNVIVHYHKKTLFWLHRKENSTMFTFRKVLLDRAHSNMVLFPFFIFPFVVFFKTSTNCSLLSVDCYKIPMQSNSFVFRRLYNWKKIHNIGWTGNTQNPVLVLQTEEKILCLIRLFVHLGRVFTPKIQKLESNEFFRNGQIVSDSEIQCEGMNWFVRHNCLWWWAQKTTNLNSHHTKRSLESEKSILLQSPS